MPNTDQDRITPLRWITTLKVEYFRYVFTDQAWIVWIRLTEDGVVNVYMWLLFGVANMWNVALFTVCFLNTL